VASCGGAQLAHSAPSLPNAPRQAQLGAPAQLQLIPAAARPTPLGAGHLSRLETGGWRLVACVWAAHLGRFPAAPPSGWRPNWARPLAGFGRPLGLTERRPALGHLGVRSLL